eukprot:PhM_4_TR19063/c0_g1_i1/m.103223
MLSLDIGSVVQRNCDLEAEVERLSAEVAALRAAVDSPPPPPSSALPRPIPLASPRSRADLATAESDARHGIQIQWYECLVDVLATHLSSVVVSTMTLSASWQGNVLACAETLGERLRDLRQGLRQLEAEKRSAQQVTPPSPSCADVFHIDNNACSRPKARAVVVCVDAADYSRQITLAQRAALDLRERRLRELERHVGVVAGYEQRLDVVEQRLGALLIGKGLLTSEKQQSVVWDPYPLTLLAHHRLDKS